MHYTLGLDIGISSVGWAVLQNMPDGEPFKIEDLGVRIFEKAEQPKTGASLALPRAPPPPSETASEGTDQSTASRDGVHRP